MKLFGWWRSSHDSKGRKLVEAYRSHAEKYFRDGDHRAAREYFRRWMDLEPESAAAWFGYGYTTLVVLSADGVPEAEVCDTTQPLIEKALHFNGLSGELTANQLGSTHLLLGLIYNFRGRMRDAESEFQSVIQIAPDTSISSEAHNELAALRSAEGDLEGAERLLCDALQIGPNNAKTIKNLNLIQQRGTSLNVLFQVLLFDPLKWENIIVTAFPDETLGEIVAREFPRLGLRSTGVQFIYSGDDALPSHLHSGHCEPHQTLRQLRVKDRDKILCTLLPGEEMWLNNFDIRTARNHLAEGRPAMAKRSIRDAVKVAERHLERGEFEKAQGMVSGVLDLDRGNMDTRRLQDRLQQAMRERDAGSASCGGMEWPHSHGTASRTSQVVCGPTPPLEPVWDFRVKSGLLTTPVVTLGKVLVGAWDQHVYCFDAASGEECWRWRAESILKHSLTVFTGSVYVVDREAVHRLDAQTGRAEWHYDIKGSCSPAIVDGEVILADASGDIRRLCAETGQPLATLQTGVPALHSAAVTGDHIFAVSNSFAVCADRKLGRVLWKREGRFEDVVPVAAWNGVYLGTLAEGLWRLNAETGIIQWIFATEARVKAAPAAGKGRIFFGDTGGRFACLDAWTGQLLWRPQQWINNRIACSAAPALAGPFVYVLLDNGALYCLEMLTGFEVWSGAASEGEGGVGALAITPAAIYYTTRSGALVCMGTADLAKRFGAKKKGQVLVPARTNLVPLHGTGDDAERVNIQLLKDDWPSSLSGKDLDDVNLALYFLMNNRLDEATAILQQIKRVHPNELRVLYNLGSAYEWQGLVGEALSVFDHLLEIDPANPFAFSSLGRLLRTHPDIIVEVFGELRRIDQTPPIMNLCKAGADLTPLLADEEAVVVCHVASSIASSLADGPAWYWWQFMETPQGPVLRLYVEFDYQPYRLLELLQPLDIADPQVEAWLRQLENQDTFILCGLDEMGKLRFARILRHDPDQRQRLRKLHERAQTALARIPIQDRDFRKAVENAETIWQERFKIQQLRNINDDSSGRSE